MYDVHQNRIGDTTLSYRYYKGGGTETIVVFHGFGQTNAVFESFIYTVASHYSVVAIDLFFHGESTVTSNRTDCISIAHWNAIFDGVLKKHQVERFSLLSYSMGSRFVVTLVKAYGTRIDKIALIAPDGFGNNFWFNVATSTRLARVVFRYAMKHPFWIRSSVRILGAVGIFNSITKRFIERNLESAEHRKKIYDSWVYFRKLAIRKDDFAGCVNKNKISLICFCGREDQLVAKGTMQQICNQTAGTYIEFDLAHHKMIQALEKSALKNFLISDR